MKKSLIVLVTVITIFLMSCENRQTSTKEKIDKKNSLTQIKTPAIDKNLAKGYQLLETVCFACHSPNANEQSRIAPTMAEIKKAYLTYTESKEEFIAKFSQFVANPNGDKSILDNTAQNYGAMPKFEFSDTELNQMASYIYYSKIEKDDWFKTLFNKEKKKNKANDAELSYAELGKKYVLSTKSVLGKNLKGAIKKKGTEHAVSFCNERAYHLTDSMSNQLHTSIKRVSDLPRNPTNKANKDELSYILAGKEALLNGKKIKPLVQEVNGKMVAYYPITTNKMCMQCHGEPNKQIKSETLAKIQLLYPNDIATGYGENELRGIWVVQMDKKNRINCPEAKPSGYCLEFASQTILLPI